jgi:SAM-dependent methyltransferase
LLLLLYPLNTWRDAPLFPTPQAALSGITEALHLVEGARIVDAGCGLGAGLIELRRNYPGARIEGLEWSWPLVLACRLRCRFARVHRADIWAADWSGFDLVYLFQRPESMPRAVEKARRGLRPGAWMVSLEFEALDIEPMARLESVAGKPVWLYQAPFKARRGQ